MKLFSALSVIVVAAGMSVACAETPFAVGARDVSFDAAPGGARIQATVWYPAEAAGTATAVADNAVFAGSLAHVDAPPRDGAFPVILLSHGGLRSAPGLGNWLASDLAGRGYLVAVLTPHDPRSRKATDAIQDIWMRPAELSAMLSGLERDPVFASHLDKKRIGAVGFSLGATSLLQMAGARIDPERYAASCDEGSAGQDCAWFKASGLDLHAVDLGAAGQSRHDPRLKAVVAVNPELGSVFAPESLSAISIPVELIGLGMADDARPSRDADGLEKQIPGSHYTPMPQATPFDAFSVCKPAGRTILQDEGETENPCDPGEMPREDVHAILADAIEDAFRQELLSGR